MLQLSNNSCTGIKINSELFTDLLTNIANFTKAKLIVKQNCCVQTYEDDLYFDARLVDSTWYKSSGYVNNSSLSSYLPWSAYRLPLSISVSTPLKINNIKFKNLTTHVTFDIVWSASQTFITIDALGDFNTITDEIKIYLNSIHSTSCNMSSTTETINGELYYAFAGIDKNIVPIEFTYEYASVVTTITPGYGYSAFGSYIVGATEYINSDILDTTSFTDGVYNIKLSLYEVSGDFTTQANCFFYDCETACKVANSLSSYTDNEKTDILMLHYGLTMGSNCACDCDELCKLYDILKRRLDNTTIITDCGC